MKYRVIQKPGDGLFHLQYKRFWLTGWNDFVYETTNIDYGATYDRPGFKSIDEAMSHARGIEKTRIQYEEMSDALSIPMSHKLDKGKTKTWDFDINVKSENTDKKEFPTTKWWIERWMRIVWYEKYLKDNTVVCFSGEGCQGISVFQWVGKVIDIKHNDDESLDAIIEIIKYNNSYADSRDTKKRDIYTRHLASKYTVTGDFQQVDGVWILFK
jgi:hypothetical protein